MAVVCCSIFFILLKFFFFAFSNADTKALFALLRSLTNSADCCDLSSEFLVIFSSVARSSSMRAFNFFSRF
uniref:Putative secreted protein n=1 Tax=Ixodes ricinus TaxID=34613 RepID=A0A6B0U1X9_IXORI